MRCKFSHLKLLQEGTKLGAGKGEFTVKEAVNLRPATSFQRLEALRKKGRFGFLTSWVHCKGYKGNRPKGGRATIRRKASILIVGHSAARYVVQREKGIPILKGEGTQ